MGFEARTGPGEIKEPRGSAQMWQDDNAWKKRDRVYIALKRSWTRGRRRARGEGPNESHTAQGLSERRQRGCRPRGR
jgi:hypothetical protein